MLRSLRASLADLARRSALGLAGAVFLLVGLGFGIAAAFQGLALWQGPLAAALILGAIFLGLGLILLAFARGDAAAPQAGPDPAQSDPMARVVDAFFEGVEAGARTRAARRPRKRRDEA
jgi:hypothetical protein